MKVFLSFFILSLPIVASWKDNASLKQGGYHQVYKVQVFNTAKAVATSPAWLYCKEKSNNHEYQYPGPKLSHMTGYIVTGYERGQKGVDFGLLKESFERYCYLPCDGLSLFYSQHPILKKTLYYIPFLNILIPYWIEGDIVQEVAFDKITHWLRATDSLSSNMFPDIPINILYSPDDPLVTKEGAEVLCYQLKKTGQFSNVQLVSVRAVDDIHKSPLQKEAQFKNTVESYEKMQWWLKNLWASKLGLLIILVPIVAKLSTHYQSKMICGLGCLIFEEILRR